jgi:hypothetical protein
VAASSVFGFIGLTANPSATSDLGDLAIRNGIRRGMATGANAIHYGQAWDLWETSEGVYDLGGLQRVIDEVGSGRLSITIAVLDYDDNSDPKVPAYLAAQALDSTATKNALNNLITAIHAIAGARPWYLCLGQEVDHYLAANAADVTPYAALITSAKNHARGLSGWSNLDVTCSFAYSAVPDYANYTAVLDACTTEGWTYYFKNTDYSFRDTNTATLGSTFGEDLLDIFAANGVQPIILIELGCSSAGTGATEALQAHWVSTIPAVIAAYDPLILGATLNWQSEFSEALMDFLGFAAGDLRTWIAGPGGGLGLRDQSDDPKTAYTTFAYQQQGSDVTTMVSRQQATLTGDANTTLRHRLASYYDMSQGHDLTTLLAMYQNRVIG